MLSKEIVDKGNSWMGDFLLASDLSVLESLEQVVTNQAQRRAHFTEYPNLESKLARIGGKARSFTYTRLNLDTLDASALVNIDVNDKLASTVDVLNLQIADPNLKLLPEDFSEITIDAHGWYVKIAEDHPLWWGYINSSSL